MDRATRWLEYVQETSKERPPVYKDQNLSPLIGRPLFRGLTAYTIELLIMKNSQICTLTYTYIHILT